ncbi:serine protease [Candidatus Parcubacteria bacterium]|nr:MAG: serine protease [Candidatus Parcubacteria bacterium]
MYIRRVIVVRLLLLQTIVVAFLFALTAPASAAISSTVTLQAAVSSTPTSPLADTTVNLYCRLKSGNKIYSVSGSGVVISERGVILTNAHVAQYFLLAKEKGRVTGDCSVRTGSPAKDTYDAAILYISPEWLEKNVSKISEKTPKGTGENDFALLYITGAKKELPTQFLSLPVNIFATTSEAMAATVVGYPSEGLDFKAIRNKLKMVAATSSITDIRAFDRSGQPDTISLSTSDAVKSGVSGGPIANFKGELIGIAAVKSSAKENPTLRGITISYINRILFTEAGVALPSILTGDLSVRASSTRASISEDTLQDLESGLRKKK